MFRHRMHSLMTIALLAQTLLCIAAAPVIGAQQELPRPRPTSNGKRDIPVDTGATIEAAINVANIRPEEVSDAEQKKGSGRGWMRGSPRTIGATRTVRLRENGEASAGDQFSDSSEADSAGALELADFLRTLDNCGQLPVSHFAGSAPRTVFPGVRAMVRNADTARTANSHLARFNSAIDASAVVGDVAVAKPIDCFGLCRPFTAEFIGKALRESAPAIQPTGPPTSHEAQLV